VLKPRQEESLLVSKNKRLRQSNTRPTVALKIHPTGIPMTKYWIESEVTLLFWKDIQSSIAFPVNKPSNSQLKINFHRNPT
jgi:hypothetical protein